MERTGWRRWTSLAAPIGVIAAGLLWAYWPTFVEVNRRWAFDARYSHGYLVPPFALWLLWHRRGRLGPIPDRPSWGGLAILALGGLLHVVGALLYFDWLDGASLLVCLAGLGVVAAGWRSLRWSGPSIAFLAFMLPLPFQLEIALSSPLQRLATRASAYAMQTLGLPALAEGNVILLDDVRIGVVEACNGLGMLITFFAIATAVAMVIDRPFLDRVAVVLSAVPVALIANVARITVTGILHRTAGGRIADLVYHSLAGWLMMPLAIGLLWAELWLLSRLLVEPDRGGRGPIELPGVGRPARPGPGAAGVGR